MGRKTRVVAATLAVAASALAQETTRVNVEFAPGANRERLEGKIEGDQSFDYIVPARAGERLEILFRSDDMGSYLDLYPPGGGEAIHKGANLGNRFEGTLPETGDYRVHVYLMPNAAHRGEIAHFTIEFTLDGGGATSAAGSQDVADGLGGGPDFWTVTGLAEDAGLKIRSGPSTSHDVVGKAPKGTRLRNLGCTMEDGSRWCHVRTLGDGAVEGWAAGLYLAEAAAAEAGGGTVVRVGEDPDAPALFVRTSGEIEVSFENGCGALFDKEGSRITAGKRCSSEQLRRAAEAVEAHRR